MAVRRALVLGGTGMLAGVTSWLVGQGWHVVVPSRRYSPIACDSFEPDTDPPEIPERRRPDGQGRPVAGRALWVQAGWERPDELARSASRALGGPAELLVAWVHGAYRAPVLEAVGHLLTPDAPVVEVHGDAGVDPLRGLPDPALPEHPTQRVVLGYVRDHGSTRWLSHPEIVQGVLAAVRRALDDRPLIDHQVGDPRPAPLFR